MNKNKIIAILIALITTALILLVMLLPQKTPTSGEIFDKAEEYWRVRKFSKLRVYIEDINKTYPTYIPAIVASAIYAKRCDVDYVKSIEVQDYLIECMEKNYVYIPYILDELLEAKLKREKKNLSSLNKYFIKNHIDQEKYLKKIASNNKRKGKTFSLMYELLIFNIPNAFITTNEIVYLPLSDILKDNDVKIRESEKELMDIVFDYEGKMVKREKARNKLVMKRYQDGGVTNLFQGFSSKESTYMALATSQKLYLIDEESLPDIVEFLNSKKDRYRDMVFWAIMMMQYNGLSKEKTLEYVNQIDEYYFEKSEYARRIREFLQTD
jgi:hypothetical protein